MRRRPDGLGVEGPLPLPLVYPDDGGVKLGKEYHQIQKICKIYALIQKTGSNTKDMLLYKRHTPIQKICSNTKDTLDYKIYAFTD